MNTVGDGRSFNTSGAAYDAFMGRYAFPLAELFADAADVRPGQTALDVGCGPGALTSVLADLLGPTSVLACDPSPPFVDECSKRCPGVQVRSGSAEALPYPNGSFDRVLSQLVWHFVGDPAQAASEFYRVVRPGGVAAACVWDSEQEMEMLRHFWDAAAGAYCAGLTDDRRTALQAAMFERVGSPPGAFTLSAVARSAVGRKVG
ncbi:hypothetical protein GCM10027020_15680 [Nocardioides salsibiostraticola]